TRGSRTDGCPLDVFLTRTTCALLPPFDCGALATLLGAFSLAVSRMLALDGHAAVILRTEPAPAGERTDALVMAAQGRQRCGRRFFLIERSLGEAVETADGDAGGLSPIS